jgi:hypothetical protein
MRRSCPPGHSALETRPSPELAVSSCRRQWLYEAPVSMVHYDEDTGMPDERERRDVLERALSVLTDEWPNSCH